MDEISYYILVPGHSEGMALYQYLKARDHSVRISPTPRMLKAQCGMSLLVKQFDIAAVKDAIAESGMRIERIVELENQIDPLRECYC